MAIASATSRPAADRSPDRPNARGALSSFVVSELKLGDLLAHHGGDRPDPGRGWTPGNARQIVGFLFADAQQQPAARAQSPAGLVPARWSGTASGCPPAARPAGSSACG